MKIRWGQIMVNWMIDIHPQHYNAKDWWYVQQKQLGIAKVMGLYK